MTSGSAKLTALVQDIFQEHASADKPVDCGVPQSYQKLRNYGLLNEDSLQWNQEKGLLAGRL